MPESRRYDIIIAGAGLSGLSLAWHLVKENYKGQILLIDVLKQIITKPGVFG